MTQFEDDLDQQVADALARAWVECWSIYSRDFLHDASVRADAFGRACELYAIANRVWSRDATGDMRVAFAAVMVREIGDGYALMCGEWAEDDLLVLPFPRPRWMNDHMVEFEMAEWCELHGRHLELEPRSSAGWDATPAFVTRDEVASSAAAALRRYRRLMGTLGTVPGRAGFLDRRDDVRAAACREIADARRQLLQVRIAGGFGDIATAIGVRIMLAESVFVLTSAQSDAEIAAAPVVTETVVSDVIEGLELDEWFAGEGIEEQEQLW
jgi:hypothetical protein